MGCQGEIYNVLGVEVDAEEAGEKRETVIYKVNGKTVCSEEGDDIDFYNGIPTNCYGTSDLSGPLELIVRVLGHSDWMGSRHFDGKAILGFVMANECYIDKASELPAEADMTATRPKLLKAIKQKFGLDIDKEDIKLFLVFDSLNG